MPWTLRAFRLYKLELSNHDMALRTPLRVAQDAGVRGMMLPTAANPNMALGPWREPSLYGDMQSRLFIYSERMKRGIMRNHLAGVEGILL